MRIDTRPRHKNAPRPAEKCAPQFLQWLRGRQCVICAKWGSFSPETQPRTEAAHVDYAGDKGMGTKVSDRFAIPLCGSLTGHHALQHNLGWETFEARYNIDALDLASQFWKAWPGRLAWEKKNDAAR